MDAADALLFALLAFADLALMIHLHRRRARRIRFERMMRSLKLAVQREIGTATVAMRPRYWALRRAS